jgi:hypothetical protein
MFNPTLIVIDAFIKELRLMYERTYTAAFRLVRVDGHSGAGSQNVRATGNWH